MKTNSQSLAILIPVKDESHSLPRILQSIHSELQKLNSLKIIFIDDGSNPPLIGKELRELCKDLDLDVTVIELSRNFGKEAAIKAGLSHVRKSTELIAVMDGDGQHPVSAVRTMFERMVRNKEIECSISLPRSIVGNFRYRISRRLFQSLLGKEVSKFESDLLMIRSSILAKINQFPETAIRLRDIVRITCTNVEVIDYLPEKSTRGVLKSESRWSLERLINQAFIAIVGHDNKLFSLILRATAWLLCLSIGVFLYTFVATILTGARSGTTTLLFVLTLMFTFQVLALFVTIYYLRITLLEVKARPRFLISKIWRN